MSLTCISTQQDRLKHYRDRAGQVKSKALTRLSLEHTRAKRREAVKVKLFTVLSNLLYSLLCILFIFYFQASIYFCTRCMHVQSCIHVPIHIVYANLQAKSSAHRFKVTSQMRCLQSSDTDNGSSSTDTASAAGGEGAVRASNNVHICDAMQDSEKDDVEDIRYDKYTCIYQSIATPMATNHCLFSQAGNGGTDL